MIHNNNIKNDILISLKDFVYELHDCVKGSIEIQNSSFSIDDAKMNEINNKIIDTDNKLKDESAPIKIGIAGRMKAGKSMLADLLFFNGESILRSDTTPATANITYIQYATEQYPEGAFVEFISETDVLEMRNYYDKQCEDGKSESDDSEIDRLRLNAIKELLNKIDTDHNKSKKLIGSGTKRISLNELAKYSDKDGEYSDFVNAIRVYINDERLKDVIIVDTPGLGDPVVSREQKARDEIRTCDAVFFLSMSTKFMDMVDAKEYVLLKQSGCKEILLIMSRFDESLDEDDFDNLDDFSDTLAYMQMAQQGINTINSEFEKIKVAPAMSTIIPVCALGAKLALNKLDDFNDDEFYRNKLSFIFSNWNDKESILELSGYNKLNKEIEKVRLKKEMLKQESNDRLLQDCMQYVYTLYQNIHTFIDNKILECDNYIKFPPNTISETNAFLKLQKALEDESRLCLSQLRIDKVYMKCDEIIKNLKACANSAKAGIDNASSPTAINGAYELNFKNSVQDMFIDGIKSNMRFYENRVAYGELFDYYGKCIGNISIPNDISSRTGTLQNLFTVINSSFKEIINNEFEKVIDDAMPYENINLVLADGFTTVRLYSPDYKYKEKPWRGRSEKNNNAKAKCRDAVDEALSSIIKTINYFKNNKIQKFFDVIQETVKSKIESEINSIILEIKVEKERDYNMDLIKYKNMNEELDTLKNAYSKITILLN